MSPTRPSPQETEPFAKCQRCQKREADLTTPGGEKVCVNCATPAEVAIVHLLMIVLMPVLVVMVVSTVVIVCH